MVTISKVARALETSVALKVPRSNGKVDFDMDLNLEEKTSDSKKRSNDWYNMSPFMNGYVKVFDTRRRLPSTMWVNVWVHEQASFFLGVPYKPVPKSSLIYKYIKSKDSDKQKVLKTFEDFITSSYLEAREFLAEHLSCQSGIEIVGQRDHFMSAKGFYGGWTIEITHPYVDYVLDVIEAEDNERLANLKKLFKASMVHEFTHQVRKEFEAKEDIGQEIASHAIEILAGSGENPCRDEMMQVELNDHSSNRYKDILIALKIVQQKLSSNKHCKHIPKNSKLEELNKAMKSIPEPVREKELKKIAGTIINASYVELFRIAARV